LVRFLFWKTVKTEPNWIDGDFIGSNIFLTKNRSKPNRYAPKNWQIRECVRGIEGEKEIISASLPVHLDKQANPLQQSPTWVFWVQNSISELGFLSISPFIRTPSPLAPLNPHSSLSKFIFFFSFCFRFRVCFFLSVGFVLICQIMRQNTDYQCSRSCEL